MKKVYAILLFCMLCLLLAACSAARQGIIFNPVIDDRTNAVLDINSIDYSTTEITEDEEISPPEYFEVVAASTTAPITAPERPVPTEYFMVKFVDYDGYSMISVQNVAKGTSASEPPMPQHRGELVFRGWDKDFSNVRQNMIVKAIYQKEFLTVRFFDVNGSLLKKQTVSYGEDATPPEVTPPEGYVLVGWTRSYKNITNDVDLYPSYTASPKSNAITIIDAYEMLTVKENTLKLPVTSYYRKEYKGICTIGKDEYAGNIIYGNFSDRLDISGYGFNTLEGFVGLKNRSSGSSETQYLLLLYIYVDDTLVYQAEVTEPGTKKEFSIDLTGAKSLTIRLEPYVDDSLYYIDADFIGGLIDAIIY